MEPRQLSRSPRFESDDFQDANRPLTTLLEERTRDNLLYATQDSLSPVNSDDQCCEFRSPKRQRTRFACGTCDLGFTEQRALARHTKTDRHRKQLGLPPDRRHKCTKCSKFFTRGHDLKRHQDEQHTETPTGDVMDYCSSISDCSTEQASSAELMSPRLVSHASDFTGNTSFSSAADIPSSSPSLRLCESTCAPNIDTSRYSHFIPNAKESVDNSNIAGPDTFGEKVRTHQLEPSPPGVHGAKLHCNRPDFTGGTDRSTSCGADADNDSVRSFAQQLSTSIARAAQTRKSVAHRELSTLAFDSEILHRKACALCDCVLENHDAAMHKHLEQHLEGFYGQYYCQGCYIAFVHKADLDGHLQSAVQGHCGFNFQHTCTGHHPPSFKSGRSGHDRTTFSCNLQNWEQAQLRAHNAEVNELTASHPARRSSRCSDVFVGSSRRNSFSSFAISVNTYATAPCDSSGGKIDLGGLQKRLQQMSLSDAGSRVRRLMHSSSSPDLRSRTIDRSLEKAVRQSDVHKASKLLLSGADTSIIHRHNGPFIAIALWGLGQVSALLAQHRIDEDVTGSCSVCRMTTDTLSNGYNKANALLRHRVDPNNAQGGLFGPPLATAAWMGKADIVKLLLAYGADVRQKGGRYGTALCAAAAEAGHPGHREVAQVLLRSGADVKDSGKAGTAIELARQRRKLWEEKLAGKPGDEELVTRIQHCDEVIRVLEEGETVGCNTISKKRGHGDDACRGKATAETSVTDEDARRGLRFVRRRVGTA